MSDRVENTLEALLEQPLWQMAADGLLLVDDTGTVRAVNPVLDELFGYSEGELLGQSVERLIAPDLRTKHVQQRAGYVADPVPRSMAASQHLEGQRANGTRFPINVSLSPFVLADTEYTLATVRDLTDRVRAETESALANRRRALAEDHDRIANELHDTVIQRLFALGLGLQGLPDQIANGDVAERVSAAVDTLDDIIRDIRASIYGLRRHIDSEAGVRQRLLEVVDEVRPSLGIDPEIVLSGPIDDITDGAVIGHLIPVLREALSNVARHAAASSVSVRLSVENGTIVLEVDDDGRGLPADAKRSGLSNMADRAVALRGRFEARGSDNDGTIIRWVVPLRALPDSP